MSDQALEKLVQRLTLDAARLECGAPPEAPHVFSPAFERKMRKLLRRGRHPAWYKALRGAACLLLALLLSGCAVLAVSPGAREVFAGWVREVHETHFRYHFFEEFEDQEKISSSEETAVYQPAYVPAGYRMEFRSVLSDAVTIIYANDESGKLAAFHYFTDLASPVIQIERDSGVTYKKVLVGKNSADLYLDGEAGEANILVWVDREKRLAFNISGVFGQEELVRMAESVRPLPREAVFRPSWLPEGYFETGDSTVSGDHIPDGLSAGKHVLTYEDGKGGRLTITYAQEFELSDLRPARPEAVSVLVGQTPAFFFPGREADSHLVWVDSESGVLFWLSGPFTGEELIRVAEGLEKYEGPSKIQTAVIPAFNAFDSRRFPGSSRGGR